MDELKSKVVSEFPANKYKGKYARFLDGRIHAIEVSKKDSLQLRTTIGSIARRNGIVLHTRHTDGVLYVQAVKREDMRCSK